MKKSSILLTLALVMGLGAAAGAVSLPEDTDFGGPYGHHGFGMPYGWRLQRMNEGMSHNEAFDGKTPIRTEGALEIMEEQTDVVLSDIHKPGHTRCHGGRIAEGGCDREDPMRVITHGNRQVVRIADRDAYVKGEMNTGMLWGGAAGAGLGLLLGFLLNPIVGLAALAAGVAAGAFIAKSKAEKQPETFNRDVVTRTEWIPE